MKKDQRLVDDELLSVVNTSLLSASCSVLFCQQETGSETNSYHGRDKRGQDPSNPAGHGANPQTGVSESHNQRLKAVLVLWQLRLCVVRRVT